MGGMGLIFTPVLARHLLRPSRVLWLVVLGLIATPNSLIGRYNLPPASHPPPTKHPTPSHPPLYTCNPWYYSGCEKVAQNPTVLASYCWWSWNTSKNTAQVIQQIQSGYNLVQENHGGFITSNQYFSKYLLWHYGWFSQIQSHIL